MNFLRLSPVFISALLLAAHFFRLELDMIVVICICAPFLIFFRRIWAARSVQVYLILGALEWVRTLIVLVSARMESGEPWIRLAVIIALLAIFTGASSLVFLSPAIKKFCREKVVPGQP